uniref:Uncharacterized protein n=1 Tax=Tetranychus urticae TaxID=32264 RepID=T1K3H5_TETUR
MLPLAKERVDFRSSMWPKFACVDNRAAMVISKLPLRPKSDGTRMKSSLITLKTGQC